MSPAPSKPNERFQAEAFWSLMVCRPAQVETVEARSLGERHAASPCRTEIALHHSLQLQQQCA